MTWKELPGRPSIRKEATPPPSLSASVLCIPAGLLPSFLPLLHPMPATITMYVICTCPLHLQATLSMYPFSVIVIFRAPPDCHRDFLLLEKHQGEDPPAIIPPPRLPEPNKREGAERGRKIILPRSDQPELELLPRPASEAAPVCPLSSSYLLSSLSVSQSPQSQPVFQNSVPLLLLDGAPLPACPLSILCPELV